MHVPSSVSRYDPKFTAMTMKQLESVILQGTFSGNKGRGGLCLLPKNVTVKESYVNVSENNLHTFWDILVMHNDAPTCKSKTVA